MEKAVKIPVLGSLPELPVEKVKIFKGNFALEESMHLIRENLNYMINRKDGCPVIMVSSTIPGEGKSLVSSHLATAYAKAGKKIVVLGCDLRNPRMNEFFGKPQGKGLSAWLAGIEDDVNKVIEQIDENLYAIFGGTVPPNPTELVSGERMHQLLTKLKAEFSYIILDTPPLGVLADGFTLSKYADACVYVVRANVLDKKALKLVAELDREKRINNLGIVLNGVKMVHGKYGYGYGYGYGYCYGYGYGYDSE